MLYFPKLAQAFVSALLDEGIYVMGFFYPVLPKERVRICVQLSAAHTMEQLQKAVDAFVKMGKQLDVISGEVLNFKVRSLVVD